MHRPPATIYGKSETFQYLHTGGVAIHKDYFGRNVFCLQQGERFLFQCNQGPQVPEEHVILVLETSKLL